MYNLKACVVCLSTDVKLFSMNSGKLRHEFLLISGIQTYHGGALPDYLCFQCAATVKNFIKFRDRCQRAHCTLKEIINRNKEINISYLKEINHNLLGISPPLSFMSLDRTHYAQVKFQWKKHNRINWSDSSKHSIPIAHCSTLTAQDTFDELTNLNTASLEFSEKNIKTDVEETLHEEIDIEYDVAKSESVIDAEMTDSFLDNDNFESAVVQDLEELSTYSCKDETIGDAVDGSNMDEEYATMIPISLKEAKAAMEVYKMFSVGRNRCEVCGKAYNNESRLNIHLRMHDKHVSGNYHCGLCQYYYKTEFLLKTHMTEKHLFKYLCRKCPEVSFDR